MGYLLVISLYSSSLFYSTSLLMSTLLLSSLPPAVQSTNITYGWQSMAWSACTQRQPHDCCSCTRHREVHCQLQPPGLRIPSFYCRKLPEPQPHEQESCARCAQDCVHSPWGVWSACSESCASGTRHRVRAVLQLPTDGGRECGPLIQTTACLDLEPCEHRDNRARYKWKVGPWTSCIKGSPTDVCGQGTRQRQIYCTDKTGQHLADQFCLQYMVGQPKPKSQSQCTIPCACEVTSWSSWSSCSRTCVQLTSSYSLQGDSVDTGYQSRSRRVVSEGEGGVGSCPYLAERRQCVNVERCDRYVWQTGDWGNCSMGSGGGGEVCGSGRQYREVSCVLDGDPTLTAVENRLCRQEKSVSSPVDQLTPPSVRACEVSCGQDCELGQWQAWSVCSHSCGSQGRKIRRRSILVEATGSGVECGERYETQPCEETPCSLWHIGKWSACFLEDYEIDCGTGIQIRNVYCVSSLEQVLQDDNCSASGDKPSGERGCKVPCSTECLLSDWSAWSTCTKPCGFPGGNQTRTRFVMSGSDTCVSHRELAESRVCNQKPCDLPVWQVTAWSPCRLVSNATTPCGEEQSGTRFRRRFCQANTGQEVASSQCDYTPPPSVREACQALCPRHCVLGSWQEWSDCGAPCGTSYKHRFREVQKVSLYGGTGCEDADNNGQVEQSRTCHHTSPCHTYTWTTGPWGSCDHGLDTCGHGISYRNVFCQGSDSGHVSIEYCVENILSPPPTNQKSCYKACEADCALSEWSEFSLCSVSCGVGVGVQTRYRALLHPDSSLSLEDQCPSLSDSQLLDTRPCEDDPCPVYHWEIGPWTSCVTQSKTDCGPGIQKRHIFCHTSVGDYTSPENCSGMQPMPETFRQCEVSCQSDCGLSAWTEWGPCSEPCGYGISTRNREVSRQAVGGGRRCGLVSENRSCLEHQCENFMWVVAEWGDCIPHYNLRCGEGQRARDLYCPAGIALEAECRRRAPKPVVLEQCHVPCLGDCELSQWSSWSVCDCSQQNASKSRIRALLTEPSPGHLPCGPLKDKQACPCPGYTLVLGNWTSCVPEDQCGLGYKVRSAQCLRHTDWLTVPLSFCTKAAIQVSEACEVPCPRDCVLSKFSSWSSCRKKCGVDSVKERRRNIRQKNNRYGRQCPARSELTQNTTCESVPCYEYQWVDHAWSVCSVNVLKQCGLGSMSRITNCVRSDGYTVHPNFCGHDSVDSEEAVCGLPCPGDCVMSLWSQYGPCFSDCRDSRNRGQQVRSRTVIVQSEGGSKCSDDWVQRRSCSDPQCPYFYWRQREWDSNGRRKVFCTYGDGEERVHGGCVESRKPARKLECNPKCGLYTNCLEGVCVCHAGFRGDGISCLPEYGCHGNLHCIANHSYCDATNKECLCHDGTLPSHDLVCPVPLVGPARGDGVNSLFLYMMLGCLGGVILVAAAVLICIVCRKKSGKGRNKNKAQPTLRKIDNLEAKQNNTLQLTKSLNLQDDGVNYPSYKSEVSDSGDINLIGRGGREGLSSATSMPLYYGNKTHNLNLNEHPTLAGEMSSVSGTSEPPQQGGQNRSLTHLGEVMIPPIASSPSPFYSPSQGGGGPSYMASVQPMRSSSAMPYISYHPPTTTRTPTPSTEQILSTFKPEDPLEERPNPWHNVHNNAPPPSSPHDRHKKKPMEQQQPADGSRLFPISPHHHHLMAGGSNSSGHSLYRVPEHLEHHLSYDDDQPQSLQQHSSNNHTPRLAHKRSLSKDSSSSYKRPNPYIAVSSPAPEQMTTSPSTPTPVQEFYNGGNGGGGSTYNSLPRHYPKLRPQNHHNHQPPEELTSHSDMEQGSTGNGGGLNHKYGSLPSKHRAKKDAAQNLLDYCDALLADLEKAASS